MIIGKLILTEDCQIRRKVYTVHFVERETSNRIHVVRAETDKSSNDCLDQIMYGQKCGPKLVKPLRIEKTIMEEREARTRQCSTTERNLLHWSWWPRLRINSQKMWEISWKDLWQQLCFAKEKFQMASRKCLHKWRLHPRRLQKRFMFVSWRLMSPRDNECNLLSLKLMKITL